MFPTNDNKAYNGMKISNEIPTISSSFVMNNFSSVLLSIYTEIHKKMLSKIQMLTQLKKTKRDFDCPYFAKCNLTASIFLYIANNMQIIKMI